MHDFPSATEGRAVPYGIYAVAKNRGWVMVGQSADTPEFAVEAKFVSWWEEEGCESYPEIKALDLERHKVCPEWNYTIRPRLVNV